MKKARRVTNLFCGECSPIYRNCTIGALAIADELLPYIQKSDKCCIRKSDLLLIYLCTIPKKYATTATKMSITINEWLKYIFGAKRILLPII